ncbi:MAG: aldehyde ferredoxin oxidoreductase, partial [Candidatus Aminicenantes bacterium]|nr:aldehyde ferredoxin oxidoreductase [Candidatus Aminicenantes bacterium]
MIQGYNNRGLDINLSTGKVTDFEVKDTVFKKYLGGRGIGAYFLKKELSPTTEPLSPENLLVISTGGLSGSLAPAGGRFSVTFKSPLTGTISSANSGGFWGNSFKRTGYDVCIIRGKASVPVYLYISENRVD